MQDELTVTLHEDDFVEAYRPAPRRKKLSKFAPLLAAIITVLIIGLLVMLPEARIAFKESRLIIGLTGAVLVVAALLAGLMLAAPALRRRAAHSTMADHAGMREPVRYAFDPEHFSVQSTYTQARYPWAALWDWREGERAIMVLPTPRNFYVIPKRGVDPAILERLRGYLMHARKRAAA